MARFANGCCIECCNGTLDKCCQSFMKNVNTMNLSQTGTKTGIQIGHFSRGGGRVDQRIAHPLGEHNPKNKKGKTVMRSEVAVIWELSTSLKVPWH